MGKNGKRRFRGRDYYTQENGRERGLPGMGDGPFQETMPMGHAGVSKNRQDIERRMARKMKERRWDDDE